MQLSSYSLFSYTAYQLSGTEPVWIDLQKLNAITNSNFSEIEASAHFSKMSLDSKSTEFFGNRIETNKPAPVFAEIYGGGGISTHAGGARSCIFDGILIKGSGLNPVSGKNSQDSHATGMLCLADALLETIYSHLLNAVLPHGAETILGIIYTGGDTACSMHPTQSIFSKDHGALLLRRPNLRPASFLAAPMYIPSSFHIPINEEKRLFDLFSEQLKKSGSINNLINWFVEFVFCCADQLSYAYVNSIMHGGLSSSNYSMSGKWIDLTLSTFIENRKNYSISSISGIPTFHEEYKYPIGMIKILSWEMSKYLNVKINQNKICEMYIKEYHSRKNYYLLEYIGVRKINDNDHHVQSLINELNLFLSNKDKIFFGSPMSSNSDIEIDLFVSIYKSINTREISTKNKLNKSIIQNYLNIIGSNNNDFYKKTIIKKIRFLLYRKIFYRARIIEGIRKTIYSISFQLASLRELINEYLSIIGFAFEEKMDFKDKVTIFVDDEYHMELEKGNILINGKKISIPEATAIVEHLFKKKEVNFSDVVLEFIKIIDCMGE
jgi:hypothetical protein